MKTGRKTADPARKRLQGTYRDDRHGNIVALVTPPASVPVPPPSLTKEAKLVWDEEFARVCACGVVEADSSLFARYCQLEAFFRGVIMGGDIPPAAYFTELRRMGEALGIGGIRSRLGKMEADAPAKESPFTMAPNAK